MFDYTTVSLVIQSEAIKWEKHFKNRNQRLQNYKCLNLRIGCPKNNKLQCALYRESLNTTPVRMFDSKKLEWKRDLLKTMQLPIFLWQRQEIFPKFELTFD